MTILSVAHRTRDAIKTKDRELAEATVKRLGLNQTTNTLYQFSGEGLIIKVHYDFDGITLIYSDDTEYIRMHFGHMPKVYKR